MNFDKVTSFIVFLDISFNYSNLEPVIAIFYILSEKILSVVSKDIHFIESKEIQNFSLENVPCLNLSLLHHFNL